MPCSRFRYRTWKLQLKMGISYFLKKWNLLLKRPHPIFLSNNICLNLIDTFVMSRNKHISKKPCVFPTEEVIYSKIQ